MHSKKSIAAQKDKNYIMIVRSNIRQELYYYDSAFKYESAFKYDSVRSNNVARDEDANNGDAQVNETLLKTRGGSRLVQLVSGN